VVIVGLGRIGLGYDFAGEDHQVFTHTKACLVHHRFELVMGIDPRESARRDFESFSGRPASPSLTEAGLKPGGIDLVIVSTPTAVRVPVLEDALLLRPRILLVEKPLAATAAEAETIMSRCAESRVQVVVNYFRYYTPGIQSVLALAPGLGGLSGAICHYSGGVLNNASHFVSLLLQWFGTPDAASPAGPPRSLPSGDHDVSFRLDFGRAEAFFFPVDAEYGIGELDILFRRGRIRFTEYCEEAAVFGTIPDPCFSGYRRLAPWPAPPTRPALDRYQYFVMDALAAILGGEDGVRPNSDNALETLRICEKVIREATSAHRGS